MKRFFSLGMLIFGGVSGLLGDEQKPLLPPQINAKNILIAIKEASRSTEYRQAYTRACEESAKVYSVFYDQIKQRLSTEEQAYVVQVLQAAQDLQTHLAEIVTSLQQLPEDQRKTKLQSELVKLQQEGNRLGNLLSPFVQNQDQKTPEEKADFEAWGFEMINLLLNSLKQTTQIGLAQLANK